jgi:hypothetical protein
VYIRPGTIASLLKAIEGITDVRKEGFGGIPREIHVRFKYQGYDYVAWEPYGDNSRYWIGPDNPDECKKSIRGLLKKFSKDIGPHSFDSSWETSLASASSDS